MGTRLTRPTRHVENTRPGPGQSRCIGGRSCPTSPRAGQGCACLCRSDPGRAGVPARATCLGVPCEPFTQRQRQGPVKVPALLGSAHQTVTSHPCSSAGAQSGFGLREWGHAGLGGDLCPDPGGWAAWEPWGSQSDRALGQGCQGPWLAGSGGCK